MRSNAGEDEAVSCTRTQMTCDGHGRDIFPNPDRIVLT